MGDDYLPPELQLIAENELGETEDGRIKALEKLNRLLDEEPELHSRRDNLFLLRFLRVRKYNVDRATSNVKEYYGIRKEHPSVFENLVPSCVSAAARSIVMVLPQPDIHGRLVVLLPALLSGAWNPQTVSFKDVTRAMALVGDYITADPVVQTIGLVCIHDYGGFTVDKIMSVSYGKMKMVVKLLMDCLPARTKAIHIVRESYAFDMVYAVIRHSISKKLAERFHFYGHNFDDLHKDMPVDMLPNEYGGLGPDPDFEAYWSGLDQAEPSFVDNNGFGYHDKGSKDIEVTAF
ncbi:unnamed protein product [Ixodes hexagonus]